MVLINLNDLENFLNQHIGKLSEVSLKHRGAILFLSVLMLFIDPNVKVTFDKASIAGLGISVEPSQTIYIGIVLLILLIYRLIAFWASVVLESGTDVNMAEKKAMRKIGPSGKARDNYKYCQHEENVKETSRAIIYKWNVRKIIWEFVFPNILALIALTIYLIKYYNQVT